MREILLELLKEAKKKGLNKKELAEFLGFTAPAVRNWEKLGISVTEANLRKIAKKLSYEVKMELVPIAEWCVDCELPVTTDGVKFHKTVTGHVICEYCKFST